MESWYASTAVPQLDPQTNKQNETTCYASLDVSYALQENPVETPNQDIL
jgi:hypothetical protein